jgi:hypothetical protein
LQGSRRAFIACFGGEAAVGAVQRLAGWRLAGFGVFAGVNGVHRRAVPKRFRRCPARGAALVEPAGFADMGMTRLNDMEHPFRGFTPQVSCRA